MIWSIKTKQRTGSLSEKDIQLAGHAVYNGEATVADMDTYFRNQAVDPRALFSLIDFLFLLRETIAYEMVVESKNYKGSTYVAAASDYKSSAHSAVPRMATREESRGPAASDPSSPERPRPTGTNAVFNIRSITLF